MAKIYSYSWSIGKWADRATLNYTPIDCEINGLRCSCDLPSGGITSEALPVRMEDTEAGDYYLTYSSNEESSAIIRINVQEV